MTLEHFDIWLVIENISPIPNDLHINVIIQGNYCQNKKSGNVLASQANTLKKTLEHLIPSPTTQSDIRVF